MQTTSSDIEIRTRWLPDTIRRASLATVALAMAAVWPGTAVLAQSAETLAAQRVQYDAERAKSIVELQLFRQETSAVLPSSGKSVRLISLNPESNAWFLLSIGKDGSRHQKIYHIENPNPAGQHLLLVDDPVPALVVSTSMRSAQCTPWTGKTSELSKARASGLPFAPLCGGRLYLRNHVTGSRSSIERTTGFLRDHVWNGESIVRFVRDNFFKDAYAENSEQLAARGTGRLDQTPSPAEINPTYRDHPVITTRIGLGLSGTQPGQMTLGIWYPVEGLSGVFASAIQPRAISNAFLHGPGKTNRLDSVESRATDYLVAFDLSQFELGFALGTDHPRVDWSPRPSRSVRRGRLPGPDGIGSPKPLVRLGMVSPALADRTVAAFTAGFKRRHGAFKYGDYATINRGSHYGFIEQGVIFSKLQTGLSTLFVLQDGTIEMKTWREEDNALLSQIRFARQNGVPILETDPATGLGVPGSLVPRWGPGNWSGSADMMLRTLRAGACIRESGGKRFLVHGYFSTATPSAMARTFQAYGCKYAMMLDMNALEHTYLALYVHRAGKIHVEHLIPGMSEVDKKGRKGNLIPRFIGFPDNRDLFYLVRRKEEPSYASLQ